MSTPCFPVLSAFMPSAPFRTLLMAAALCLLLLPSQALALFDEITVADEAEMGREFDKMVRKMLPIVDDPVINKYVEGVVTRVYDAMPPQPFRVKTAVIHNGSLNAFAVPGGYVYIFTGLLAELDNEDEMAAVIGHELAHVSQRHVADRIEKMEKVSFASLAGTLAGVFLGVTGNGDTSKLGQALVVGSQAASYAAFLNYTQENEREADHVGIGYLTAAGYNPEGMPRTFEIMLRNQFRGRSTKIPNYLRTHPKLSERADYLRQRIKEMTPEVTSRPYTDAEFLRIRALARGRTSDPTWAVATLESQRANGMTCYDAMALGMAQQRLKHTKQAKEAFDEAMICGSNDPLILREAGIFHFKAGDFTSATKYLQKALFRKPNDIYSLYYMARLLGEQGNYSDAIRYMESVLEQLNTDAEVYYHLGRYEGASGDHFQGHLYLAYSSFLSGKMEKYAFHEKKAEALAETKTQKDALKELRQRAKEQ